MTKEEREKNKELVDELKAMRRAEGRWMIMKGKVIQETEDGCLTMFNRRMSGQKYERVG